MLRAYVCAIQRKIVEINTLLICFIIFCTTLRAGHSHDSQQVNFVVLNSMEGLQVFLYGNILIVICSFAFIILAAKYNSYQ